MIGRWAICLVLLLAVGCGASDTTASPVPTATAPRLGVPALGTPAAARTVTPPRTPTPVAKPTATTPATPGPAVPLYDWAREDGWGVRVEYLSLEGDALMVAVRINNTADAERPLDLQGFRLRPPDGPVLDPRSAALSPGDLMHDGRVPGHGIILVYLTFDHDPARLNLVLEHAAFPWLRLACPVSVVLPTPTSARPPTSVPRRYAAAPPLTIDPGRAYTATIRTSLGDIVVQLDAAQSPLAVNNFVFLAREHFYDRLLFHRAIKGFLIQGGDPTGTGTGGPGYRFPDEPVQGPYEVGDIAMANGGPNTNGSQFFICEGPQCATVPPHYSRFGTVVAGIEVVHAIAAVPTTAQDRPIQEVWIVTIEITEQ